MSRVLLDTHVLIWYANGNQELKKTARNVITESIHDHHAYISAISLWEIGMLDKKQRIILEMPCLEWIKKILKMTYMQVVPLTPEIATESCFLPGNFHEDPSDRIITATARVEGLTLITRDVRILKYGRQKHVSTFKA